MEQLLAYLHLKGRNVDNEDRMIHTMYESQGFHPQSILRIRRGDCNYPESELIENVVACP